MGLDERFHKATTPRFQQKQVGLHGDSPGGDKGRRSDFWDTGPDNRGAWLILPEKGSVTDLAGTAKIGRMLPPLGHGAGLCLLQGLTAWGCLVVSVDQATTGKRTTEPQRLRS